MLQNKSKKKICVKIFFTKFFGVLPPEARTALLERQFMKSLPQTIRLRLLESNPTPSLPDMRAFIQRYHAVHHLRDDSPVMVTVENLMSAQRDELHDSIRSLKG